VGDVISDRAKSELEGQTLNLGSPNTLIRVQAVLAGIAGYVPASLFCARASHGDCYELGTTRSLATGNPTSKDS
jgi:hypothetical protein